MSSDSRPTLAHKADMQVVATSRKLPTLDESNAIQARRLTKCYQIYEYPQDRIKQALYPRLQRMMGREPRNYYREFMALEDVSFHIKKGETVGIIGRNGSGKSTLLQIICGTLRPTAGSVETKGRVAALLELGSGFNPEFTGRENVYINGAVLGLSRAEVDARFSDIVAFADIGDFIDQPVKTYSSGMYVRLAFAVIAHADADILVVDEALSVGDAFFVQKCMRFLRRFMETGTVLFVSHDLGAVQNLCSRAIWLHKGEVRREGEPKVVTEAYLAAMYESNQGPSAVKTSRSSKLPLADVTTAEQHDMRRDFINDSSLRNDIEIVQFKEDAESFGKGGVTVTSVALLNQAGVSLLAVVGGENVSLVVVGKANQKVVGPIVGFFVKDRLGQTLFGDNTYLTYCTKPLTLPSGQVFRARFDFRMPILPVGDYSICVAVAEGTQVDHVQHQWIHDAVLIKSVSSSVSTGLIGIPMTRIEIALEE